MAEELSSSANPEVEASEAPRGVRNVFAGRHQPIVLNIKKKGKKKRKYSKSLKDFQIGLRRVTKASDHIADAVAAFEKMAGGDRNYDVYVRYREGSSERCLVLSLKRRASDGSWSTTQSAGCRHNSRARPGLSETDRARASVPTRTTSTP